jgi:hypothetical protein
MARSRPKLTFEIIDQSFVLPADSLVFGATKPILGCYAPDLHLIATASELQDGYITETSSTNWFGRIRDLVQKATGVSLTNDNYSSIVMTGISGSNGVTNGGAIGLLNGAYGTEYTIEPLVGSSGATLAFGITNQFRPNWWAVQNALQYGTSCRIGIEGKGFTGPLGVGGTAGILSPNTTATDFAIPGLYSIIFQSFHRDLGNWTATWTGLQSSLNVVNITNALKTTEFPVIGVVNVGITGAAVTDADIGQLAADNEYMVQVAGDKYHLNSVASTEGTSLIRTHLAPDVAACIANTPRVWDSPAGNTRGRILGVVKLSNKLTAASQDALYDLNVNPVISVPGSGALLYGDITNARDTSSLVSINVIRTIIFIKSTLIVIANEVLFEKNTIETRLQFATRAELILNRILAGGGLTEFSVVCDSSNNPQEIIDAKAFVADISVKIPGSINYINISLTNK